MTRLEKFMQLKAFARQDGMIIALLWTVSFACTVLVRAGALGNLLAIATPFAVGWRLTQFRNYALGGTMSLRRAYAYGIYTFFYASIVFAIVQWAYFQFVDNGAFATGVSQMMAAVAPIYRQNGFSQEQISQSISIVGMLTPIQWAFMFMMQNIFIGVVLSLPIALCCRRGNLKRQ